MNTFSERINYAIKLAGVSQSQLAERVGLSQPAIQKLTSGKATSSRKVVEIAAALGVRPQWLAYGDGTPEYSGIKEPSNIRDSSLSAAVWEDMNKDESEFVEIPLLDVSLSAGNGSCDVEESTRFALVFRRNYLNRMGVPESAAKLVRVNGYSMEPTLHDGDVVGVNTLDVSIRDGKTYAICQGDLLRVKTLIATPSSVIVRSINREEYPDEIFEKDDFIQNVRVIGRVFWSSHSW